MIDVFTEDFVLTARAKGLTRKQVIRRHVVPNALLPVTTMVVTSLALMFTGAFSIEVLFSWPGMGRLMVDSVTRQDYPVMQATNYLIAVVIILTNLVVDLLYSYLDPRVRIQ
jgi:peptide/nickel transport system permease protein